MERWGSYKNVSRNPATQATGRITATGVVASTVTAGDTINSAAGLQYTAQETKSIVTREHLEIYKLIFMAFLINFFFFDALYHPVPRIIFWSFLGVMASLAYRSDEELEQNA
ncbi:MAG: baseplate J/gp47 family protein [Chloroflexi bacterium]|nr:baseplate J/gp47 family protein [Chloroflexota bacterium]